MTEEQQEAIGPASFCIPRAAIEALLDAQASVYEIAAYLVLARFTDATGCYSTASLAAVNRYTGANKTKGGPVDKAIKRLLTIRAVSVQHVSNGRSGKSHAWVEQRDDLGPILVDRASWLAQGGEPLPDGPTEHGKVRYVLPDFGESLGERVWIGGNLVTGIRTFDKPLRGLRHAGNIAARLLLALYAANDMEIWGGARPVGAGRGPWRRYEPIDENDKGRRFHGARLLRCRQHGEVASIDSRVSGGDDSAYWPALEALLSHGLIYEVVMVLNREARPATLANGGKFGQIPDNAEPYYELDTRSKHGYKPAGEEGIGWATARTAGELGFPVTRVEMEWSKDGTERLVHKTAEFDGTYAALVPAGQGAMIAGIYRLRFRVSNRKNAGVRNAWARIHEGNREAFEFLNAIREAGKLAPLSPTWPTKKPVEPTEPADQEAP